MCKHKQNILAKMENVTVKMMYNKFKKSSFICKFC